VRRPSPPGFGGRIVVLQSRTIRPWPEPLLAGPVRGRVTPRRRHGKRPPPRWRQRDTVILEAMTSLRRHGLELDELRHRADRPWPTTKFAGFRDATCRYAGGPGDPRQPRWSVGERYRPAASEAELLPRRRVGEPNVSCRGPGRPAPTEKNAHPDARLRAPVRIGTQLWLGDPDCD
jgi:hypothetical protein